MYLPDNILVLAPHTDDAELGCGGTIARLLEEGKKVSIAVFSTAEESLPEGAAPGTLKLEFLNSMKVLGIKQDNLYIYNFPVRRFSYNRQEILEEIVVLRKNLSPDMVFVPSSNDLHQDHKVIHEESLRAFKNISILGYELPWNNINFSAQALISLKRNHINKKWQALQEYKTQFKKGREYFSKEFFEGLARVHGTQIKCEYAEAFEVIRLKWD